jgi:hypothetical protein
MRSVQVCSRLGGALALFMAVAGDVLVAPSLAAPPPAASLAAPLSAVGAPAAIATSAGAGIGATVPQSRHIRIRGRAMTLRPDGQTVPIMKASVDMEDEDWGLFSPTYEPLSWTYTDADGYFDTTFLWNPGLFDDTEPDIVVTILSTYSPLPNQVTMVDPDVHAGDLEWYTLTIATIDDYSGTDLDTGTILAGTQRKQEAFYAYTQIMRAREWIIDHVAPSFLSERLVISYPTNHSGAEIPASDLLEILESEAFDDHAVLRELARKWHRVNGQHLTPDLVNGVCDGTGHGYCLWCAENDHDAWEQGFCYWFADVLVNQLATIYGEPPLSSENLESLATCSGVLNDPLTTAGFVAALLHDIQDSEQDDHLQYASGLDALSLGYNEILTVVDADEPATVAEFIDAFHARYPQWCEELWQTAKNCGYDRDVSAPGAPTSLTSPSHAQFSTSPDATVQFTWTSPSDDMSCIDGYGFSVTADGFAIPTAVKDMEQVTSYTTAPLAPGTYYFNLRAVDNAGRWSATYATYGPFTIAAPEPANLVYELPLDWAKVLVPRATGDATANSVTAPTTLTGNVAATYWNVAGRNAGALATSSSFSVRLYVDGIFNSSTTVSSTAGGASFNRINRGPMTVRGGRHTYEALLDGGEQIAETSETDNRWAEQWIWTPLPLADGVPITRNAPPDRTAGWDAIGPGPALYYNCDGLRLTTTGWWNAVTVHALNDADDYDCRLHAASSSALPGAGGFGANAGYSARGAGGVDAVLVNRNVTGAGDWDVGVLNSSGGASQYIARHVTSQTHPFGTRVTVPMVQDQTILLREFHVGPTDVGWVDILVDVAPQDGPVSVLFLDETFSTGDLLDFDGYQKTGLTGQARLETNISSDGYNCVAVYRDPKDGTGPINVTIEIGKTPPDFRPHLSAGWYAPVVPRSAGDANAGATAAPLTLTGNAATTWMNLAVINDSPAGATATLPARLYLDGTPIEVGNFGMLAAYQINRANNEGPYTVAGGRHTLYLRLDPDLLQREISESNNAYGEQWIWSPLQLSLDAPQSRPAPPYAEAGFEYVRSGEPLYFDCDGLRTPVFASSGANGYWGAVAVMPGTANNVDLRLHRLSTGPKDGFASSLAESFWPTGQSDFVLVDFNSVPFAAFDAGVLNGIGAEPYTVEVTSSHHLGLFPNGTFGPYTMGANQIVDVHEAWLAPGVYICRLENVSGSVDWGFSLYPTGVAYHAKSDVVQGGASWLGGPGEMEPFQVQIGQAGYYAFAAWKVRSADLGAEGSYQLVIHSGATDVPEVHPGVLRTAIASVCPNPFNPRTTIAYELQSAKEVQVRIADTRGKIVRTLARGYETAGRHELVWDGTDDGGRVVASGVYVLRLTAGAVADARKLILLK